MVKMMMMAMMKTLVKMMMVEEENEGEQEDEKEMEEKEEKESKEEKEAKVEKEAKEEYNDVNGVVSDASKSLGKGAKFLILSIPLERDVESALTEGGKLQCMSKITSICENLTITIGPAFHSSALQIGTPVTYI